MRRGSAQEVERGAAQAVAAEEGEVAVAAEGVGGAFGYLGGLAEGAAALAPTAGEVLEVFATFVVRTGPREFSRGSRACSRNRRVAGSIPPWSAGGRRKMQLAF